MGLVSGGPACVRHRHGRLWLAVDGSSLSSELVSSYIQPPSERVQAAPRTDANLISIVINLRFWPKVNDLLKSTKLIFIAEALKPVLAIFFSPLCNGNLHENTAKSKVLYKSIIMKTRKVCCDVTACIWATQYYSFNTKQSCKFWNDDS